MARIAVDLFCGSGGVTEGLKRAGWLVAAAIDNDPIAAATYRENHPEVRFVEADIRRRDTIARLKQVIGEDAVDLMVICAPCQPFSSQNRKRGDDLRKELILQSLSAVRAVRPRMIFFENVPGLVGPNYAPLMDRLRAALQRAGYHFGLPSVEDAAAYGVPQRRRRCIMFAARTKKLLARIAVADKRVSGRTVRDAIGDLPRLASGETSTGDNMHAAREHSPIALARLRAIPRDGGSRSSLPGELVLKCHKNARSFSDVYGRMSWDDVAPTLTTGCTDVTRGRYAHPEQDRAITLREAARLQTFDDDYKFVGNVSQIAIQIGNAVPPAMIAAMSAGFGAALDA